MRAPRGRFGTRWLAHPRPSEPICEFEPKGHPKNAPIASQRMAQVVLKHPPEDDSLSQKPHPTIARKRDGSVGHPLREVLLPVVVVKAEQVHQIADSGSVQRNVGIAFAGDWVRQVVAAAIGHSTHVPISFDELQDRNVIRVRM